MHTHTCIQVVDELESAYKAKNQATLQWRTALKAMSRRDAAMRELEKQREALALALRQTKAELEAQGKQLEGVQQDAHILSSQVTRERNRAHRAEANEHVAEVSLTAAGRLAPCTLAHAHTCMALW